MIMSTYQPDYDRSKKHERNLIMSFHEYFPQEKEEKERQEQEEKEKKVLLSSEQIAISFTSAYIPPVREQHAGAFAGAICSSI